MKSFLIALAAVVFAAAVEPIVVAHSAAARTHVAGSLTGSRWEQAYSAERREDMGDELDHELPPSLNFGKYQAPRDEVLYLHKLFFLLALLLISNIC
ncbi:MAG TPA: hypothetical protein VGQ41_24325 [Pyrinomonadaceae bacterium]|jgi:hypothetical protein|nr:hypothetical protein [Pyrinomonadaceae bacterium]